MTTKVKVKNFQSIKEAEIEIDGFTVVTGKNNSGKTALQRAIRGVFQNTRGSNFVRHGETHCEVSLTFDDGQTVTWEKGAKVNKYIVNGKTFDKVGHGVPKEVAELGLYPLSCATRQLWPQIAPQFTGQIFLLDEPGSVLAEAVSDVERVSQLNKALKKCDSDKRSLSSTLKVREKDKKTLTKDLESYAGLKNLGVSLAEIKDLESKLEDSKKEIVTLSDLSADYASALETEEHLSGIGNILIPNFDEVEKKSRKILSLKELKEEYEETSKRLESLSKMVADLEVAWVGIFEEDIYKQLDRYSVGISKLRDLSESLDDTNGKIETLLSEIVSCEKDLEQESQIIHEILGEHDSCPVCQKEI